MVILELLEFNVDKFVSGGNAVGAGGVRGDFRVWVCSPVLSALFCACASCRRTSDFRGSSAVVRPCLGATSKHAPKSLLR